MDDLDMGSDLDRINKSENLLARNTRTTGQKWNQLRNNVVRCHKESLLVECLLIDCTHLTVKRIMAIDQVSPSRRINKQTIPCCHFDLHVQQNTHRVVQSIPGRHRHYQMPQ